MYLNEAHMEQVTVSILLYDWALIQQRVVYLIIFQVQENILTQQMLVTAPASTLFSSIK